MCLKDSQRLIHLSRTCRQDTCSANNRPELSKKSKRDRGQVVSDRSVTRLN